MGKTATQTHVVNGYSRYDTPRTIAFPATPGILYPVRVKFVNARDRITLEQGVDVRSNALTVPTFNPYTIRLHRFFCPMQLYHPEMRVNSVNFDMNKLSRNLLRTIHTHSQAGTGAELEYRYPNSLLPFLRLIHTVQRPAPYGTGSLVSVSPELYVNADPLIAYWDIVRCYYSYSDWRLYSVAYPFSGFPLLTYNNDSKRLAFSTERVDRPSLYTQRTCDLRLLNMFYEQAFYPNSPARYPSTYNNFSTGDLNAQLLYFHIVGGDIAGSQYGLNSVLPADTDFSVIRSGSGWDTNFGSASFMYQNQVNVDSEVSTPSSLDRFILAAFPFAVAPSSPDRYSRLLPLVDGQTISMSGVTDIPKLAVAARMQEYLDLLGTPWSTYKDWLKTFFASKIRHVDRPTLLFSASALVNTQVVLDQANTLGQQGGTIAFNDKLGRKQTYYFEEPGYLIDIFSVRPVYYWSDIVEDYAYYREGMDYFNPLFNDLGYQDLSTSRIGTYLYTSDWGKSFFREPIFNEFRSSYDEALGYFNGSFVKSVGSSGDVLTALSSWLQQRNFTSIAADSDYADSIQSKYLFVDMSSVNQPFGSNIEDNLYCSFGYKETVKNLVNKSFATKLALR